MNTSVDPPGESPLPTESPPRVDAADPQLPIVPPSAQPPAEPGEEA